MRDRSSISSELLPGTLEMLILKILSMGPAHGYAVARELERISADVLASVKVRSTLPYSVCSSMTGSRPNGASLNSAGGLASTKSRAPDASGWRKRRKDSHESRPQSSR